MSGRGVRADIVAFIALAGCLFSVSVVVEVIEKLDGSDSPTWSVLKLMGPQLWSPINGDPVRLTVALAIALYSMVYFVSCWILERAALTKNAYFVVPWIVCEGATILYQTCAAFNASDRFTKTEESLLILDTLIGFAAIGYVTLAGISWMQMEPSTRRHRATGDDAEARLLHPYSAAGDPEGQPLPKARKKTTLCMSKTSPKSWKRYKVSLLEKLAAREITGGRRIRFQAPKCSPKKKRKVAQRAFDMTASLSSVDATRNEDSAVLCCVRGDSLVKCVKPFDIPRTVFRFRQWFGDGSARSTAVDGNNTNGQCTTVDCDYWPCNESASPSNGMIGDVHLQSGTISLRESMDCDTGRCFRGQETGVENIYDVPEYIEETTGNVSPSNVNAQVSELKKSEVSANGVSSSEIRKFTTDGDLKLHGACHSIACCGEGLRARDPFITTDSFIWSRSLNISLDENDLESSTGNEELTRQQIEAISGRSSPVNIPPPGTRRAGNIWMWAAPESTKRLLLSGGEGLGYVYSASDMDLVVFGRKDSMYQGSLVSIGTSSVRDSVGVVLHRKRAPGIEPTHRNSWDGSIADIGATKFLQWIPTLSGTPLRSQSWSSLS
ncbi:uncharacterized protein LOC126278268 [Schistocerca gregaria]|uniref:uncharacterized protein LOC126278268 n=1 Tax=Schistocerca gregaria TaxID=7010 RepID=UPI00211E6B5A|nr:uncharacterized protein LOC126278268 [Schistocerca gregaria]